MPDRDDAPGGAAAPRSKTRAALLALLLGVFGAHRFYLRGPRDLFAWLPWPLTLAGVWGLWRALHDGFGDRGARVALPLLGLSLGLALWQALFIGLRDDARWNARWNTPQAPGPPSGWGAVLIVMVSLLLGTAALMGALAFALQGLFAAA